MEIKFKFIGSMKFQVGGKNERILDIPEGCTVEDALLSIGVDHKNTAAFGFAVVNGEKVDAKRALQRGDEVKIFSRSFGG
jgi:sulfur carrier protein ThiS